MTTKDLQKLRENLGGIRCDLMNGDNLAITLCSHFDDGEESECDHCWSPAAIAGCDQTLDAIHAYYAAEITKLRAERDAAARDMRERCKAAVENLRVRTASNFVDANCRGQRGADRCDALYDAYQAIRALPDTDPALLATEQKGGAT